MGDGSPVGGRLVGEGFGAFREALSAFLEANQFLSLALYVGIEEVGVPFPVPADTLIIVMGYQVWRGEAHPALVLAVVVGSATAGASIQYWLGRYFGTRLINRFRGLLGLTHARQRRAESWMRRYQVPAVILLRLVPGFRVILTLVAGASRIDFRWFVPSVAVSATIWASFFMGVGWALGDEYESLVGAIENNPIIGIGIAIGVGLLLVAFIVLRLRRWIFRRGQAHPGSNGQAQRSPATTPPVSQTERERPPV